MKKYRKQLEEFHKNLTEATQQGFEAVLPNGEVLDAGRVFQSPDYIRTASLSSSQADAMLAGMHKVESSICGDSKGALGGVLSSSSTNILAWSQSAYGNTPDGIGRKGARYVQWGPYNAWPNLIDNAISSNPFLSSVMDYLERTLFGLGPQVMYCITRYSGGTVTHEEVPYRDADVYLKEDICRLIAKLDKLTKEDEKPHLTASPQPSPQGRESLSPPLRGGFRWGSPPLEEGGGGRLRDGESPPKSSPLAAHSSPPTWHSRLVAKYEKQLEEAERALESYWKSRAQIDAMLENNSLSYFYKRWIYDMLRLGICFPMVGLSRSGAGKWEPKIVELDMRSACTVRMEERNPDNQFRIEHVYYSERWRDDACGEMLSSEMVAYPALMPEHALSDLRRTVRKHNRTRVGQRPSWQCCPSCVPTPSKPVYPRMAWWSIFPSMVYQLAVTSLYDKAAARKNSTMWGKILFINTAYLAQVFNQAGEEGKTREGQAKIRSSIYQSVENFLKDRSNNGKLLVMDSYPSADEKQMIDSVRIVDVPRGADVKASAQEIAEIASLVSFSFGTNVDLVASRPWSTTSATGTAQRELHLLKNGQLSPDRLTFTDFFNNFVFPFNEIDQRFRMTVPYPTLTTLDNSKTGLKTISDTGDE